MDTPDFESRPNTTTRERKPPFPRSVPPSPLRWKLTSNHDGENVYLHHSLGIVQPGQHSHRTVLPYGLLVVPIGTRPFR
ncbi:hypothetical protein PAXRUDRAFT_482554 [Paxillus rubicundulus Ve08.2h10]|uniref:Uncharacterized protein n=1 Tax=Paxillus rubicundulus Ve08.2h10 TaxID=930991 RepID=A0A0D0DA47_9AGAM|nr:hypothetical protein PAXRUDRAFT_482554 [Paxillus rubicundulus Ve08.2h10]